jgi:hypothetical protein
MLFLLGIDIAGFTRQASGWTVRIVLERLPRRAIWLLLLPGLALRLRDVAAEAAERLTRPEDLGMYAGALLGLLSIAGVWLALRWIGTGGEAVTGDSVAGAAERWAMPLVLAFHLVAIVAPVPGILILVGTGLSGRQDMTTLGSQLIASYNPAAIMGAWQVVLYTAALGTAAWLARRGRGPAALYVGSFGAYNLWMKLSEPGGQLGALAQRGAAPEDFWLVTLVGLAALGLWLRRALTAERAGQLLFLLLITGLLRQTSFIENPFSPFLGFAGIGFIAFALVWDATTRGAWANEGTPGLPRTGRVLLYIGYVLLTVTLVNWALTSHSLLMVGQFTGDAALNGLDRFGRPLLYAVMLLTLVEER